MSGDEQQDPACEKGQTAGTSRRPAGGQLTDQQQAARYCDQEETKFSQPDSVVVGDGK